ncbi:ATP-binding cassette domain-containing protein [bacterium]|nr:ATP-binding cassette domain-containing protein [bacterium]
MKKIDFNQKINLKNINYSYPNSNKQVLKNINIEIFKGESIGIIGETGSGKSTLIDLIMGLLIPSSGEIILDNISITNPNLLSYQNIIAHVSQDIFLVNDSFTKNIAFGIDSEMINNKRVIECAKKAQAHNFISSSKHEYETSVGERGVQLSGGQIQRIGIARALYKKAEIIIFDEATSALDSDTENKVMNSIGELNKTLTIIMIAHRLTTLFNCDKIIKLDSGKIVEITTPQAYKINK